MTKEEVKTEWLKALRSGEYKQGTYRLRWKNESYCCLGVLCNIVDPSRWSDSEKKENFFLFGTDGRGFPPSDVLDAVGLSRNNMGVLIEMNDRGKTFAEIADWIEAHV